MSKNKRCSIYAGEPQTKGLFIGYIRLEGFYGGVYANCKRQDRGSIYEIRDVGKDKVRVALEERLVKYRTRSGRSTSKPITYKPVNQRRTKQKPSPEL
jgi:hypothetical protein